MFSADKNRKSGRQRRCRVCHAAAIKASRDAWLNLPPEEQAARIAARQSSGVKRCRRCERVGRPGTRSTADFHSSRENRDGLRNECKDCVRELRWKYNGIAGMTVERYDKLLAQQGFQCAIPSCGTKADDTYDRLLDVDHNHETGEPRGLLCRLCNALIGQARESVAILNDIRLYLEGHRARAESP